MKRPRLFCFVEARTCLLALASCVLVATHSIVVAAPINYTSQGMAFVVVNPSGRQPFGMGTYEVTVSEYVAFLNSVAATDTYSLYSGKSDLIARAGASGSYRYATQPFKGNVPVNNVNWYQAARFANWMTNNRVANETESGAYALNGDDPAYAGRQPTALYFIPTREEWAEAAYGTGDGLPENYWLYATQSNVMPRDIIVDAFGDGDAGGSGNSANYNGDSLPDAVANVGTSGGPSFYGTFDMSGNVGEIVDEPMPPYVGDWSWAKRWWVRGGDWANSGISMAATAQIYANTFGGYDDFNVGFRLATVFVPEPSQSALALAAGVSIGVTFIIRSRFRPLPKTSSAPCHTQSQH